MRAPSGHEYAYECYECNADRAARSGLSWALTTSTAHCDSSPCVCRDSGFYIRVISGRHIYQLFNCGVSCET